MNFKELLGKQMLFFDGATGTQLQERGLQPGELPESWNFTHPDIVEAVHRSYLDVGSNIVKSNTFGANPLKLAGSFISFHMPLIPCSRSIFVLSPHQLLTLCFVKSGNTDVPGQTAFSYTLPSVSCANASISIPSLYMK